MNDNNNWEYWALLSYGTESFVETGNNNDNTAEFINHLLYSGYKINEAPVEE